MVQLERLFHIWAYLNLEVLINLFSSVFLYTGFPICWFWHGLKAEGYTVNRLNWAFKHICSAVWGAQLCCQTAQSLGPSMADGTGCLYRRWKGSGIPVLLQDTVSAGAQQDQDTARSQLWLPLLPPLAQGTPAPLYSLLFHTQLSLCAHRCGRELLSGVSLAHGFCLTFLWSFNFPPSLAKFYFFSRNWFEKHHLYIVGLCFLLISGRLAYSWLVWLA